MATYVCPVSASVDDYDWVGTGGALIQARWNNGVTPSLIDPLHFKCDTSAVPVTEKVVGLTVRFYENSYAATRGVSKIYDITIRDLTGTGRRNLLGIAYLGTGFNRTIILPTDFYPYVFKGSGARTWLSILFPDPKPGNFRTMDIRSYDYAGTLYTPQVTVTTTNAERSYAFEIG